MAGLVPATHALCLTAGEGVDARDEPGHDGERDASSVLVFRPLRLLGPRLRGDDDWRVGPRARVRSRGAGAGHIERACGSVGTTVFVAPATLRLRRAVPSSCPETERGRP
jgi:hypothetical protein